MAAAAPLDWESTEAKAEVPDPVASVHAYFNVAATPAPVEAVEEEESKIEPEQSQQAEEEVKIVDNTTIPVVDKAKPTLTKEDRKRLI